MSNLTSSAATAQLTQTASSGAKTFTVADVAAKLNLKPQKVGGKLEYHGANPTGDGATKDGFILFEAGNASDRNGQKYTSPQVAKMAGLSPDEYAPFLEWKARSGHLSPNGTQTPPKRPESSQNGNGQAGAKPTSGAAPLDGSNGHSNSAALESGPRVLWLPAPDDLKLLRAVVNNHDVATRVLPDHEPRFQSPLAQRIYGACSDIWLRGSDQLLTPQTLAAHCKQRALETEFGEEYAAWCDCAKIALSDLNRLPDETTDWAKEGEALAKRMAKEPMFRVLSHKERRGRPRLSWLIDQIFPMGGTSWLTAGSGELKSFWALNAALCIATGRAFHGREVKKGNVVYIAAEGAAGFADREEAWAIRNGCKIPDLPEYGVIEQPADIAAPEVLLGLIAAIRALSPTFIVVDTQARCSVGRDLNSTAEATLFYQAVSNLARELGAQVLVLAHNNRNGQYAGNHQGPAMVDTHLTMKREGKKARLRCTKQKDGAPEEAAAMDFEARTVSLGIHDEKGREITSLVLDSIEMADESDLQEASPMDEMRAKVLDVLRRYFPKGGRATAWQEKCRDLKICQKSAFYDRRDELVKGNEISLTMGVYLPIESFGPPSPPSPPDQQTDQTDGPQDAPGSVWSVGPPSPSPVGTDGPADHGPRTRGQKTKANRKNAAAASEPYAAPEANR